MYRLGAGRRDFLVSVFDDSASHTVDYLVHLTVHVTLLADDLAAVVGFRHHAVFVDHIEYIAHLAALAEGVVAVHADEFRHLLRPGIADDKHLREVEFFAIHAKNLRLNEANAGKAPAGA